MKKRLVTGGCGFIGSHFVGHLLKHYPDDLLVNLDLLTYAGDPEKPTAALESLGLSLEKFEGKSYFFSKGDICDQKLVEKLFRKHQFDEIINIAAETHVDNSILGPRIFIQTNVTGTMNLLDVALRFWKEKGNGKIPEGKRYLQVSTDEVYGSRLEGAFQETDPLNPSNPYSASKAAGDLLVQAYFVTYGMPVLVSRCSNNFGPCQDFEYLAHKLPCFSFEDSQYRTQRR